MPRGIFTLGHVSSYKIIQTFELNLPYYFKIIIIIIFLIINIVTHGNISFAFNYDENGHILVVCDNMYTMESKHELVFVDFCPSSNTFCCL
jgi:hypothetical protein